MEGGDSAIRRPTFPESARAYIPMAGWMSKGLGFDEPALSNESGVTKRF